MRMSFEYLCCLRKHASYLACPPSIRVKRIPCVRSTVKSTQSTTPDPTLTEVALTYHGAGTPHRFSKQTGTSTCMMGPPTGMAVGTLSSTLLNLRGIHSQNHKQYTISNTFAFGAWLEDVTGRSMEASERTGHARQAATSLARMEGVGQRSCCGHISLRTLTLSQTRIPKLSGSSQDRSRRSRITSLALY